MANQWSQEKILGLIMKGLPYVDQIEDIDLAGEKGAVRFTWRSTRYRVSCYAGLVEVVEGGMLAGNNEAILLGRILELADRLDGYR